jgi:excisionase family DNA binding protein
MKKSELKELYQMMFPNYPDIVNITQLQTMLGVSRHLAYKLISDGYIKALIIGTSFKIPKVNVIEFVMDQKKNSN